MFKTPTMKQHLIATALLFALATAAQAQEAGSSGEAVPVATTGEDRLHLQAEENTRFFMKRYGITGQEQEGQIYQAYLKYLKTSQEFTAARLAGSPTSADAARALELLKAELQQLAGREADPSIPR